MFVFLVETMASPIANIEQLHNVFEVQVKTEHINLKNCYSKRNSNYFTTSGNCQKYIESESNTCLFVTALLSLQQFTRLSLLSTFTISYVTRALYLAVSLYDTNIPLLCVSDSQIL